MQTLHYTPALIRSSLRRSIVRILGPLYFVALAVTLLALIAMILQGRRDWFVGAIGVGSVWGILLPIVAIIVRTRGAMQRFNQMDGGAIDVDIGCRRLLIYSKLGSAEIPLSRVRNVWCYPDVWVLLAGRTIIMSLPIAQVDELVKQTWLDNLRAAGAKIS
jgi:hypothetical protein